MVEGPALLRFRKLRRGYFAEAGCGCLSKILRRRFEATGRSLNKGGGGSVDAARRRSLSRWRHASRLEIMGAVGTELPPWFEHPIT